MLVGFCHGLSPWTFLQWHSQWLPGCLCLGWFGPGVSGLQVPPSCCYKAWIWEGWCPGRDGASGGASPGSASRTDGLWHHRQHITLAGPGRHTSGPLLLLDDRWSGAPSPFLQRWVANCTDAGHGWRTGQTEPKGKKVFLLHCYPYPSWKGYILGNWGREESGGMCGAASFPEVKGGAGTPHSRAWVGKAWPRAPSCLSGPTETEVQWAIWHRHHQ